MMTDSLWQKQHSGLWRVKRVSPSRQLFLTFHLRLALVTLFSPSLAPLSRLVSEMFLCIIDGNMFSVYEAWSVDDLASVYDGFTSLSRHYSTALSFSCCSLTFFSPLCPRCSLFFVVSPGDAAGRAGLQPAGHASVDLRPQVPGHSSAGDHP